jgi:hypothetical protein
VWVITCVKIQAIFQHDISDSIVKDPTHQKFLDVFRSYQIHHNEDVVFNDPNFCSRRYVVGTYACPQAIGNHMHEFLNNYAAALITNRTLLWKFCNRKPCLVDFESDCSLVLERFSWLPSLQRFESLWKEKNCTESAGIVDLVDMRHRYNTEEIVMCCGIDKMDKIPLLNFGTHEMHELMGVSHRNALLQNDTKARVRILFEQGDDFLYGVLFRTAFKFMPSIISNNDEILRSNNLSFLVSSHHQHHHHQYMRHPQHLVLGVHLRHSATVEDVQHNMDNQGIACVNKLLAHTNHSRDAHHQRPCVILLASDRNQSLNYWRNSNDIYCKIVTTDHVKSHIEWTEHGPFTGEIAMMDIEMVSRADYFIGSTYTTPRLMNYGSTFSLIIAERRASSGNRNSLKTQAKWLPGCVELVANRLAPKSLYQDPNFQCNLQDIPALCPNAAS